MDVGKQVALIYCGTNNLLKDIPVNSIVNFESEFLHHLEEKYQNVLDDLAAGKLTDESLKILKNVAKDVGNKYTN